MAILGIFTNIGVTKAQEAQNNQGFKIFPTDFSVSDVSGTLDPTRTVPNLEWYAGPISSRVVVDYNTIKFICTIPPGATAVVRTIREIYIKGTDSGNQDFLFVIAQPSTPILYDPSGSVTLEIQISLTNADLSSFIQFAFTQATEVSEHNLDPDAHPEVVEAINKAGIFYSAGAGPVPFAYRGQTFDENVVWDGNKATFTYHSITFTATWPGGDGNSINLIFDGTLTTDQVRLVWNNAHPQNTVEHNGTGSEVLAAGSITLTGGTLAVSDKEAVYRDVDGVYKRAIADGTIKSKVVGFADFALPSKRIVRSTGFISRDTTGISVGSNIFLSVSTPGAISSVSSPVQMGFVVATGLVLIGTGGGSGGSLGEGFDAVVSDAAGFGLYPTTQQAIDNCPDGGRILVAKLEQVKAEILTGAKRIDFWFYGPEAGWTRYLGTFENQLISFSAIPDSGTWRIEWNSLFTIDLAFNANALAVQNAINALTGPHLPVAVTGNYSTGFSVTWSTLGAAPLITFNSLGQDEIQHATFSNVPDNGTFQWVYNGNQSAHQAWNDNAALVQTYINALPGLGGALVTGDFTVGFTIHFQGVNAKQPIFLLTTTNNSLQQGVNPTNINIVRTQLGQYPANNLKVGGNPLSLTAAEIVAGSNAGPTTCFQIGKDYTRFIGLGLVQNFTVGIDLNSHIGTDIEMRFDTVPTPILHAGLNPRRDYHREKSFGLSDPVEIYVDTFGDYADLVSAIAGANTGDRIYVNANQSITVPLVINKEIYIEFINAAQLHVAAHMSGNVITFQGRVKTKNWKVLLDQAGVYDAAVNFLDDRGHHLNFSLELNGGSTAVNTAFNMGNTCQMLYLDAALVRNSASLTNVLGSNVGFGSNNIFIRDKELNMVWNTLSDTSLEEDVVATAGQSIVNFNALSFNPQNTSWDLKAYLDGVKQKQDSTGGTLQHYRKLSNNSIEYTVPGGLALGEVITGRMEKTTVASLGTQGYFVNYFQGITGTLVAVGGSYNVGTNKLSYYRNGIYQNNSLSLGTPGERYTEVSTTQVLVGQALITADWSAFVNEDNIPARTQVTGLVGSVLTVPSYVMGSGQLRVFRNGLLMSATGLGSSSEQYTETSSTSITLAFASLNTDIWTFYVAALTPVFRNEQSGISGTVVNIPAYVVGDQRLLAYKNGVLLLNSPTLATAPERYQETSPTSITTGASFATGDWFSFIYK